VVDVGHSRLGVRRKTGILRMLGGRRLSRKSAANRADSRYHVHRYFGEIPFA
jgi:hypothetical protein